jgi:cytoskeletal protein RodZ
VAHPGVLSARFKQDRGEILLIALVIGVILVGISAHLNISRINGNYVKKDSPAPATSPAQTPPTNAPLPTTTAPAPTTPATEPTP